MTGNVTDATAASGDMEAALAALPDAPGERKHSVVVAGHRTSVSVEPMFWDALRDAARERDMSINELVGEIDRTRNGSLSSAIRVFALNQMRSGAA